MRAERYFCWPLSAILFVTLVCGKPLSVRADSEARMQQRIAWLIERLADDNYHQRVNARWELERIGLPAFEQLRQAANAHPHPQVERAARYLVESQNVIWWLETDSVEVRELLRSYNESPAIDRNTILQQLAAHGSDDALLALARLARFESHELRSKSAALYLMEVISAASPADQAGEGREIPRAALSNSLRLTLGDSRRAATRWLSRLLTELEQPTPGADVAAWQELVAEEHALLDSESPSNGETLRQGEARAVVMRLYRWLGTWLTQTRDRSQAIAAVRPSLQLVGHNALDIRTAASWALEAELPELLGDLAEAFASEFAVEPQLGYLRAEAYLRLGDPTAANAAAAAASDAIAQQLQSQAIRRSHNANEILASRHSSIAQQLSQRGLFDWAENEYLRALELELRESSEHMIREELAQFYWFGDDFVKAAQTLQPVAESILAAADTDLPNAPGDYSNPSVTVSNYYFYLGLAAIEQEDRRAASEYLGKALASDQGISNPDVVIAMKRIADEEPYRSQYERQFERLCDSFRVLVVEEEEALARASDRMQRARAALPLASACNQLAWLLGKCGSSPQEALSLSRRSLELIPDEPAFLDTLGRCLFAAGQLSEAVRVQQRAVSLAPHERQMISQLQEFQQALAGQPQENPAKHEQTP